MYQPIRQERIRLPYDIPLLFTLFISLCRYKVLLRLRTVEEILAPLGAQRCSKKQPDANPVRQRERLNKRWYLCHILQLLVFRDTNPCLSRSLLLFNWCRKNRIKASLVIGVKKNRDQLEGHGWIVYENKPLNEDEVFLRGFSVMVNKNTLSGSTGDQ